MSRWIRMQADIFSHPMFAASELSEREAWLWLVAHAAWRDNEAVIEADTEGLRRAWGWTRRDKVAKFLKRLSDNSLAEWSASESAVSIRLLGQGIIFDIENGSGGKPFVRRKRGTKPITFCRDTGRNWPVIRAKVFERDGFACVYCGCKQGPFECDHVFPVSRGGTDDLGNLATACRPCNRSKKDKTPAEWLQ